MAGSSVILLTGTEAFLRKQKIEEIVTATLPEGTADFNYIRIDAREKSLVDILSTWEEMGFGGKRVVHIENVEKLRLKKDDRVGDAFLARIKKGGVPKAILIMEAESLDRRKAFFKKLWAASESTEFKPLRDYQLPAFIEKYLKDRGFSITPDGAEFLASFSSSELMVISSELDKLILFASEGQTKITVEDVRALLMPSRNYTHFDIQDALVEGKREKAFHALRGLLTDGVAPVVLWRFLQNALDRARRLEQAQTREEVDQISRSQFYLARLRELSSRFPGGVERPLVLSYKMELAGRRGNLSPFFYLGYFLDGLFRMMR